MFILTVVLQLEVDCKLYCDAMLALVYLIDVIVAVPRVAPHPSRILEAAEDFLQKYVSAWGHEWTIPKFHWLLHFHQQFMLNCFCLERKHRSSQEICWRFDQHFQASKQIIADGNHISPLCPIVRQSHTQLQDWLGEWQGMHQKVQEDYP